MGNNTKQSAETKKQDQGQSAKKHMQKDMQSSDKNDNNSAELNKADNRTSQQNARGGGAQR